MGRPRYEISIADQEAARGWLSRHLAELPGEAAQALKRASTPADLQGVVAQFLSPNQRRRLHGAILQSRHRDRHRSICVTLNGETADYLDQLSEWRGQSPARILEELIFSRRNEMFWSLIRRIEQETGRPLKYDEAKAKGLELISTLRSKAGQKLDK